MDVIPIFDFLSMDKNSTLKQHCGKLVELHQMVIDIYIYIFIYIYIYTDLQPHSNVCYTPKSAI